MIRAADRAGEASIEEYNARRFRHGQPCAQRADALLASRRKGDYGLAIDQRGRRLSYTVIKTIKGRRYVYEQRTWREGKRVRTESRYLGPADGGQRPKGLIRKVADLVAANTLTAEERGAVAAERFGREMEAQQKATFGETAAERAERARQEALDDLHDRYGLRMGPPNPTPIDKTPTAVGSAKENPSERSEGKGSAPAASAAETTPDATTGDIAAHSSE